MSGDCAAAAGEPAQQVDDRRVVSGIVHMLKNAGRWQAYKVRNLIERTIGRLKDRHRDVDVGCRAGGRASAGPSSSQAPACASAELASSVVLPSASVGAHAHAVLRAGAVARRAGPYYGVPSTASSRVTWRRLGQSIWAMADLS